IRHRYQLTDRFTRLRATGMLTLEEIAAQLGVCTSTVKIWRHHGLLRAHAYNDQGACLHEPPGADAPLKHKRKLTPRRTAGASTVHVAAVREDHGERLYRAPLPGERVDPHAQEPVVHLCLLSRWRIGPTHCDVDALDELR